MHAVMQAMRCAAIQLAAALISGPKSGSRVQRVKRLLPGSRGLLAQTTMHSHFVITRTSHMQRAAEPECKQRQNACHLEKFATRLKTETLVEGILLNMFLGLVHCFTPVSRAKSPQTSSTSFFGDSQTQYLWSEFCKPTRPRPFSHSSGVF